MKNFFNKFKYFILGGLFAIALTAGAINISVPSAPGGGYFLVSTSTGAYIATTSNPLYIGNIYATSTSATNYFAGNVGIGTTSPYAKLSVVGNVVAANFTATTTATSTFAGGIQTNLLSVTSTIASSTFANGINLISGCFAINGSCVGGSTGLTSYDAWTHPVAGQSATTSSLLVGTYNGLSSYIYNGGLDIYDTNANYNLSLYSDVDGGHLKIYRSGNISSFAVDSNIVTFYDQNDNSLTRFNLDKGVFGFGTSTANWLMQLSSTTAPQLALSDGTNNHWTMRNAGGNLYLATSSPTTFATSTTNALSINGTNGTVSMGNASTTQTTASTALYIPTSSTQSPTIAGQIAHDTTSDQIKYGNGTATKVLGNGNQYASFTYATSTAWSATTTIPLGTAFIAETWNSVQCFTDAGTLNVSFYDGTNRMNMFNASTTVGTVSLSTNNTFTAGEKRYVDVGTPATSPTKISCTISKSITAD